jgi:hypothetical protein
VTEELEIIDCSSIHDLYAGMKKTHANPTTLVNPNVGYSGPKCE